MFDDGAIVYRRQHLDSGEDVFMFDPHHQRRLEQDKIRAAGASLDERMDNLMRDPPAAPRPDQNRRRRR